MMREPGSGAGLNFKREAIKMSKKAMFMGYGNSAGTAGTAGTCAMKQQRCL
jgi:hypothetical protein